MMKKSLVIQRMTNKLSAKQTQKQQRMQKKAKKAKTAAEAKQLAEKEAVETSNDDLDS